MTIIIRRLASPAPEAPPPRWRDDRNRLDGEIDYFCWQYTAWLRSRKYYGAPHPRLQSVIGRMRQPRSTAPDLGPGIVAGRRYLLFHQSVIAAPEPARIAFEGYYIHRVAPVKLLAAALETNSVQVYRWRNEVARRAWLASTGTESR